MPVSRCHKLVVLGGERVGKTAIIEQFIFGNHVVGQSGLPTLGDVYEATVETEKGPSEKLHIFDTPGTLFTTGHQDYEQDHFLSIADGFILCYEITSKASYDLVVSLKQKIAAKNKDAPIVVLGNKRDLNAIREVETVNASQWCKLHGVKFHEVTVLDRDGLKDPMCYIAWRMANPGRPFPQLPSLSTTSSSSSKHSSTSQSVSVDRPPSHDPPSKDPVTQHDGAATSEEESPEASLRPFPDDAQFPKNSGAFLFADCLSSKNKYKDNL